MRQALFAFLAVLGLVAYAQEGVEIAPRIRVPGEAAVAKELSISESFLTRLKMQADDIEAVKTALKDVNGKRPALLKALEDAHAAMRDAKKKQDVAVADLQKQEVTLQEEITRRLPDAERTRYPILARLQPVIDWLKLTDEQIDKVVTAQRDLLSKDPRQQLAEKVRELEARPAGQAMDKEERGKYIKLLTDASNFNQTWLKNIESVLTDEQKKLWAARYRRTAAALSIP